MRTAHLCLIYSLERDWPVVIGAVIMGAPPVGLTQAMRQLGGPRFAEIMHMNGESYDEAKTALREWCADRMSWVVPLLDGRTSPEEDP